MKTTRITLSLDEDLAEALRVRANVQNKSFEQVVNEALRQGLSSKVGEAPGPVYEVKPADGGAVTRMDAKRYKQLLNDEDDEKYLRLTYGNDLTRWPGWLRDRWRIRGDDLDD